MDGWTKVPLKEKGTLWGSMGWALSVLYCTRTVQYWEWRKSEEEIQEWKKSRKRGIGRIEDYCTYLCDYCVATGMRIDDMVN